jgi:hypothetical protein
MIHPGHGASAKFGAIRADNHALLNFLFGDQDQDQAKPA